MPRSPSRKVTALCVDAVFMNAGSSVVIPILARRLVMSIPRSPSLPCTTGSSSSCLPADIRTLSGTAAPWLVRSAEGLSRGAAKESSAEPGEKLCDVQGRIAEIIRGSECRMVPEPPTRSADANTGRPAGCQVDCAVADQEHLGGPRVEPRAQLQEPIGSRLARRFVSPDD